MFLRAKFLWIMALFSTSVRALLNLKLVSNKQFLWQKELLLAKRRFSSCLRVPTRGNSKLLLKSSEGPGCNGGGSNATNVTMSLLSASTLASISIAGGAALDEKNNVAHCETAVFPESVLKHDTYGGITIDVEALVTSMATFEPETIAATLTHSLKKWKEDGHRGIWINLPTKYSAMVPYCTEIGFEFQYAKKGLLVMTKWLPDNENSRLPHGPTHQVGIGAVILHPTTGKMLVVQEKTGPAAKRKLWKMPTGLTDPGEDVVQAAVRESKEEVGLDVEFDRIICMRQAHGGIFNQSDMFFVCLLRLAPKYIVALANGEEVPLVPQEEEIATIEWMEIEDYCNQDLWRGSPLYGEMNNAIIRAANSVRSKAQSKAEGQQSISSPTAAMIGDAQNCEAVEIDESHCGFVAKNLPVGFRPGSNTIYLSKL